MLRKRVGDKSIHATLMSACGGAIGAGSRMYLRQNPLHQFAVHVGQPVVAALEFEREPGVVDAQAVQEGGVQVVDVDAVFGDVVTIIVGFAVRDTGLDAAAGQPDGEATRVVV